MKQSPRRAEVLSLIAFVLQLLFFVLMLFVSAGAGSLAVAIGAYHFFGGAGIWLILLLQFRQQRLAQEERLDAEQYQRLRREGKDTSVFESSSLEGSFSLAAKRLAWLERYLLPGFAILIAGYLLVIGYFLAQAVKIGDLVVFAGRDVRTASFLVGFALVSFLFSRYAVGMSRQPEWRPLRAGGSYLLSNALASFGLAIIFLIPDTYIEKAERFGQYVLVGLMLVIGVEIVLNLVLDAYRPRVKGRYRRAAYESRLLGLFSEPGGIFRTAAHAIDYQFGFKVSETWFFRLLSRAIVPLILMQGLALYLLSSFAIVPPGDLGVLERFGVPVNIEKPYESGLHLKLPWPMDKIRTFPVGKLQIIDVGFVRKDPQINEKTGREIPDLTPILWTKEHWKEEYPFMVAVGDSGGRIETEVGAGEKPDDRSVEQNDFDMLVVALSVHYRIVNVSEYGYGQDRCYLDPQKLLKAICYQQAVHYCASYDIDSLLGPGRNKTAQALQKNIQEQVDQSEMGVKITFVGLESVHPPIQVAEAFEKVVGALQEKQAKVLKAQGQAQEILAKAGGESEVLQFNAQGYAFERSEVARADGERFAHQIEAYQKGGQVYLWREYLSVMDRMLPAMRKYVITSDNVNSWIYELDLKEKLQPDLFDLGLEEPKQETGK